MMKASTVLFVILSFTMLLLTPATGQAREKSAMPYAGQEKRQIKSLSVKDIDDLLSGRGWGLAKVAELNGMPGPAHLLEFADKIDINATQKVQIQALFDDMKAQAIQLGTQFVQAERALDQMFAAKTVTPELLASQLEKIAQIRSKLRHVHLATHLQTPEILTRHQIISYNRLRGYAGDADHSKHH